MQSVDLILKNAAQVVTCANDNQPKRGQQMQDVGIIPDGAIAVQDGKIVAVDKTNSILDNYTAPEVIDLSGKALIPGLVDCHTHTVYGGNRYDEFEMRVQGRSYVEIMAAGGGIMNTVRATRTTPLEDLITSGKARLDAMLKLGTTTAEIKTGYGLSNEDEIKLLQAILALKQSHTIRIVPTFLGAHTIPPEYETSTAYLESLYANAMPQAQTLNPTDTPIFADIFVEAGVFSVEDMVAYFEQAQAHGFALKAHLDQFEHLGAVPQAIAMEAVSVDHLEVTPADDLQQLAKSQTVGVMLPTVNFNLGVLEFGDARPLIDADGILALATDYNPGSSPTISLPLVMAIACRYQKLLPAEALNACTINAAAALQLEDTVGSIEVGKQADFVVLGHPDYRSMIVEFGRNFVEQVYIGGHAL